MRNDTMSDCGRVCARSFGSIRAVESWWHGVEGRGQSGCPGIMGELGGLHAHDFQQTPSSREPVCAPTGRGAREIFGCCS